MGRVGLALLPELAAFGDERARGRALEIAWAEAEFQPRERLAYKDVFVLVAGPVVFFVGHTLATLAGDSAWLWVLSAVSGLAGAVGGFALVMRGRMRASLRRQLKAQRSRIGSP